jgi:hypothetical protein
MLPVTAGFRGGDHDHLAPASLHPAAAAEASGSTAGGSASCRRFLLGYLFAWAFRPEVINCRTIAIEVACRTPVWARRWPGALPESSLAPLAISARSLGHQEHPGQCGACGRQADCELELDGRLGQDIAHSADDVRLPAAISPAGMTTHWAACD